MKTSAGVTIIGIIEILIGIITFVAVTVSLILGISLKSLPVTIFVMVTSGISASLGIGVLRHSLKCYHLLLFFSCIVIASKILIFTRIISLNGALETVVPVPFKNLVSIAYHAVVLFYFTRAKIRAEFGERRDVVFSLDFPKGKGVSKG